MILNTLITNSFANNIAASAYVKKETINIKLMEVTKYTDKVKWNKLFAKSYSGGLRKVSIEQLSKGAIFLVACDGDKEIGYMRLTRHSEYAEFGANPNTFCVSEAYVKPFYRKKGVLRQMLMQAIHSYSVKMIHLEEERASKNKEYYTQLGFTCGATFLGDSLMYLFQADFEIYVKEHHAAIMKQSTLKPPKNYH